MGYCVFLLRSDFNIACEHRSSALDAVKQLDPHNFYPHGRDPHFAFVTTENYQKAETLDDALRAWRWLTEVDEEDNIVMLDFLGEKLGDDGTLFETIAPFVREGSIIQMAGEDGRIWRWFFSAGGVQEQEGEVTFCS